MSHLDLPNAYWALPARLLAGPYPCAADLDVANQQVAALLRAGVDFVVDLTEPGEYNLRAYAPVSYTHLDVYKRQDQRLRTDAGASRC